MAESDLATNLQVSALAVMLESSRTPQRLDVYRGALTPRKLDAPEVETAALTSGAALHDLGWMRRVAVRGADRFRWLSGMVTNTVNDLFPNTGAWNLVLNAQGHIQGDLTVWRLGEEMSAQRRKPDGASSLGGDQLLGTPFAGESGLELQIAADQFDKLLAHLNRFIIMDDVELVPLGEEQVGEAGSETAIGLTGPQASEVLERVGLPAAGIPMTGASAEWNGISGFFGFTACWLRIMNSGCLRRDCRNCGRVCAQAGPRRWVAHRLRRFASQRESRRTASI
jgi:hypothetical protein